MQDVPKPQSGAVKLTMVLAGLVFVLMMVVGLVMRAAQGDWVSLDPALFYQLMTAHGAGMGTAVGRRDRKEGRLGFSNRGHAHGRGGRAACTVFPLRAGAACRTS